jgi:cysteine desulfurase
MIYLDYAASTPVDKDVLDAYYDASIKYYANPNSNHKLGLEAKAVIDKATLNIANNLGVLPSEIIYTSGATETNNLVIKGICERYKSFGKHIIISSLEHTSIMASATKMQEKGFEVDIVPVKKNGLVDIEELKKMIREDTILVSVCSIDSELGLKEPIEEIAEMLKEYPHTYFHTDASQAIGKVKIDFKNVDLVTIAPHKFYGINGIGLLIKKENVSLIPIIDGGKSTSVYRSGTPVLPSIVATDIAVEKAIKNTQEHLNYVKPLYNKIIDSLKQNKLIHINNTNESCPYTINFSIKGIRSQEVVDILGEKGIIVSAKTSCCPIEAPSKLVYALTKNKDLAKTSIRVSLSHLTKEEEIDEFLNALNNIIEELKENGKI